MPNMKNYTLVIPDQVGPFTDIAMLALLLFREARGESYEAKVAVGCTVRNRTLHPSWYGKTYFEIITKKAQFTSIHPPDGIFDPNLVVYPDPHDSTWKDCVLVAFDVIVGNVADPTGGALFYFDKSADKNPPPWATSYVHSADIGNFHFYVPKVN